MTNELPAIAANAAAADLAEEILSRFGKTDNGYSARVGQVQIRKWTDRLAAVQKGQPVEAAGELVAEGNGPLLDPDCRDGKHISCIGPPCECACHTAIHPAGRGS